jgi:hypothetical protein
VSVTPTAWVPWPLEWRQQPLPPLADVVGSAVNELAVTSSLFKRQDLGHPDQMSAVWLTTGLWIGTVSGGLHIFNALDENGLDSQPPVRDAEHDLRGV